MSKNSLLLLSVMLTFFISFAAATYASAGSLFGSTSQAVRLSPTIPILASPPIALSHPEQVKLFNVIGSYGASTAGISAESFNQVRAFLVTPDEQMYVVPGSAGVCLVLGNASTCGDPVLAKQIGLLHIDLPAGTVTGAGITDVSVHTITETVNDTSAVIRVRGNGTYIIGQQARLRVPFSEPLHPNVSVSTD
jgi:hypothetical protein